MNARLQAALLLLLAVALGHLATSDLLLRFVRERSRPFLLIASVIIGLLALWSLVSSFAPGHRDAADAADVADDGHGHGHAGSRFSWLVALPVTALLVIGPVSLGAFSANRQAGNERLAGQAPRGDTIAALPADRTTTLKMIDFHLRTTTDDARSVWDRKVRLTGFVSRRLPDGFVLTRIIIVCCAADGLPVDVHVITATPAPAVNTWLQVTGVYGGPDEHAPDTPTLQPTSITAVPAPKNPYE